MTKTTVGNLEDYLSSIEEVCDAVKKDVDKQVKHWTKQCNDHADTDELHAMYLADLSRLKTSMTVITAYTTLIRVFSKEPLSQLVQQ